MGTQNTFYYEQKDFSVDQLKKFCIKLANFCEVSITDRDSFVFIRHKEDGFETSTQSFLNELDKKMAIDFPIESLGLHFKYHMILLSLKNMPTKEISISYILHCDLNSAKRIIMVVENTLELTRVDLDLKPKPEHMVQPSVKPDPHTNEDRLEKMKSILGSLKSDMNIKQIRDERRLKKYGLTTKEEIMNFIEGVDDEGLEKLLKFIKENFEVVATDLDDDAIEKGLKEIEACKFGFI